MQSPSPPVLNQTLLPASFLGDKEDATYVEGYENGPSVVTFADGRKEERNYESGVITGPALVVGPQGIRSI